MTKHRRERSDRSGTDPHAESSEHEAVDRPARSDTPLPLDELKVRALVEGDLTALAPMLALAAASGLATPEPIIASRAEADDEEDTLAAIEHDEYWLADCADRIIGFAVLHHVDRQRAAIRSLWIDERYRRHGIGQRLLEGTVVHCQRAGYLKLILELPFRLEKMVPLFGRLGFSFARSRDVNGSTLLEFYLDLYREPEA